MEIARLFEAMDATWPAAETATLGGWMLRRGAGGGKRVSAASAVVPGEVPGISEAVATEAAWDQPGLFRIGPGEEALDTALAAEGFRVIDPVVLYAAPVAALADGRDETARVIRCATPVEVLTELWARGGIGPGRQAVMDRAAAPRVRLMARLKDRPAGAAFVSLDREIAMIHAIEISPEFRRAGAGEMLTRGAARFAAEHGAAVLVLAVTEANAGARALYEKLGMRLAGRYHYRIRE